MFFRPGLEPGRAVGDAFSERARRASCSVLLAVGRKCYLSRRDAQRAEKSGQRDWIRAFAFLTAETGMLFAFLWTSTRRSSACVEKCRGNSMKPLIQTLYKIQKTALEANPAFMKARAGYPTVSEHTGPNKYADYEYFLPGFISSMGEFGLLEGILGDKKLCVLDIGTGPGYTPHLFNLFGHEAYGLDIPYTAATKIYKEFTTALGIKRIVHRIHPFEPLPRFKITFDLVIARWTCFNRKIAADGSAISWEAAEWDYFLKDLLQYCVPNARLFFELNKAHGEKTFLNFFPNQNLLAYFLSRGGYLKDQFIIFPCCERIRRG